MSQNKNSMTNEQLEEIIKQEGWAYKFELFGLPCLILRNKGGWWCGYVGVPNNSKLYGKNYYTTTESKDGISHIETLINNIKVHGGLTYARLKEDNIWYFGFNCAHSGDLNRFLLDYQDQNDIYRTKEYVIEECKRLAKQLKEIIDTI